MNPLRALIILFISILFSFVNCDSDYVIGSSYTLTWSAADINATTVDIILYYGGNLTSNWTLATNVDNKGHYNVDVNLTGTLIQFNIPNYSPGQFRLRYKNVSENTIYYNITEKLTVLQPVVLLNLIHGRATPNAEIIDAYINVSTFLYNQLNFIQFYAEYITLNGDTWTSNCVLNVTLIGTSSPTPSPTFAPTTRAPTTSAPTPSPTTPSPTPNPSSPPTSRPSLSPTARPTDKPTPSPTVKPSSQPTPSPTPVPVTTTAHPSLQPSSQPTAKPTEHPTPSPSLRPTPRPTEKPTPSPTPVPVTTTAQPSLQPSSQPTTRPTEKPTPSPTPVPVTTTAQPSPNPTPSPTIRPTERPTLAPVPTTAQPTFSPSPQPTSRPTKDPTTASPTKAPTTASPTKDPTTHSPTKYPTASPTGDPTTASPTTANPTPGPTPIPTLPTPSPTLPTSAPTLPTSAPISSGQVSKRKLLSGSSFSIVETPGYTLVYVQIAIPATCGAGGPYFVSVGVRNESEPEDYQYYTINAIDDRNNEQYQFISYNPSKLNLSVQVGNKTLPGNSTSGLALYNFSQYQDAKLSFEIDSEISQFDYYVVLFNIESEEQYVLACQSQRLSEFSTFGWKASTLNSSSDSFPPAGEYYLQIFWSANQEWSIIKPNSEFYQLNPLKLIKFIILDDVIYPAVSIVKSDEKVTYSTGSQSVKFRTSFNYSTLLHVYVEQCYSNSSSLNCTSYKSEETNFTYTENEQQTDIHIPKNLITSSSDKTNLTTRLHVYTKNCYGDSILDTVIFINVTSNESKKNNSSLSPGAIVGIICAGLLVVGLIAWWLCMRKPAEETYRKLDA